MAHEYEFTGKDEGGCGCGGCILLAISAFLAILAIDALLDLVSAAL